MARHVLVFPVAAETGHPGDDETRVVFQEEIGGEAQSFQDPGTERIDEDIGCFENGQQDLVRSWVAQVDGD